MKEASTWMLPLEMDKCWRKEGKIACSVIISDSTEAELVNTVQLK